MKQNVGIISQARMTSSRLPGKVLLKIAGKSLLQYHIERLEISKLPIYIATTTNNSDDEIEALASKLNVVTYRGDEHHVLSRYYECAKKNNLDIIVRVTSDCPLIDGNVIQSAVAQYMSINHENLYLSNCQVRTFPRGFDFEIFSFNMLEQAYQNAFLQEDIEHVTPYIIKNSSGINKFENILLPQDKSFIRITVDTESDFILMKLLIENYNAHLLSCEDIIKIFDQNPDLYKINAHIIQKL